MKKSMIDLAYDILSSQKKAMKFIDIWNQVSSEMGFTPSQADDNIAQLYSDLPLFQEILGICANVSLPLTRLSTQNQLVSKMKTTT